MSEMDQTHAEQQGHPATRAGRDVARSDNQRQDDYDAILAFAADIDSGTQARQDPRRPSDPRHRRTSRHGQPRWLRRSSPLLSRRGS
jgi:hypothetical protein